MVGNKKYIAVILAGGVGTRSGFSRPKQLIKLAGKPLIAYTLQAFHTHALVDEIAIVTNEDCAEEISAIVNSHGFSKVRKILNGGSERYESSLSAIKSYESEAGSHDLKLIFHDAVRPLVTDRIITDVIRALDHYNAVDVVIPSSDTVVEANVATGTIAAIPVRGKMRLGQTPQAFAYQTIKAAYDRALQDPKMATTDDCGVVLRYMPDERIYLVEGATSNMKLTFANDLPLLDKLMQCNASRRLNATNETVLLRSLTGKVVVIFGGTSGIGAEIAKLAGAYDARVKVFGRTHGTNIADFSQVENALDEATRNYGRIDAVINTAAVLHRQPLAHMAYESIADSIQTNITGAVNVAKASYHHLAASKGHLLMFSSSSYTYGRAYYSIYSATKAAVVNLTQALADEWAEAGIKVNCINPERTRTAMRTKAFGIEPEGSLLEPDVVARKALGVIAGEVTGYVYDVSKT